MFIATTLLHRPTLLYAIAPPTLTLLLAFTIPFPLTIITSSPLGQLVIVTLIWSILLTLLSALGLYLHFKKSHTQLETV